MAAGREVGFRRCLRAAIADTDGLLQLLGTAAQTDVEAAYRVIADNHPAMVAEANDPAFRTEVQVAYEAAKQRATRVDSFPGYAATLSAFAVALKDRHLRSRPTLQLARPSWAGIILGKRGTKWVVTDEDHGRDGSLLGSTLDQCDGKLPDELGREILGTFRVDWDIGAQQVQAAPWVLVDEGNPFVKRPEHCTFTTPSKATKELRLDWRPIHRDLLAPRLQRAVGFGEAGYGVRQVGGGGFWISLQSLTQPAQPVVKEIGERAELMQKAPFVVLDLRGNAGGSSFYGLQIAARLMGDAYVEAILPRLDASDCEPVWRISPANVDRLRSYLEMLGAGPEVQRYFQGVILQAEAAQAAGEAFSGPVTCKRMQRQHRKPKQPPMLMKGKLAILTDGACFSSCLIVVNDFRKLGAIHLGQTTDANTHYIEVRDDPLPSGLSTFSTLQGIAPGEPQRIGPFTPDHSFDGDIADTTAVERWTREVIQSMP